MRKTSEARHWVVFPREVSIRLQSDGNATLQLTNNFTTFQHILLNITTLPTTKHFTADFEIQHTAVSIAFGYLHFIQNDKTFLGHHQ